MTFADNFIAQLLQNPLLPRPAMALPQLAQYIRLVPDFVIKTPCSFWWHATHKVIPLEMSNADSGKLSQDLI